ncbi:hypothetical protein DVS28_b0439 (plasmid) [Euzebya pacifica]|uniref:Phosphoribosyl transferase domain-containing protein n=1 Tax=Euzebya pacifica TaxID=1608957 RepID=A0A346Y6T2_9ACTN|nr:hypothetical protein DVS28_b0439 [Euzebya pacifica]
MVVDLDALAREQMSLGPIGRPVDPLPRGLELVTEAAAHAGIPVYGLTRYGRWNASAIITNTDLHITRVVEVPVKTETTHGFAIPETPDHREALYRVGDIHVGLDVRNLLLVGPAGGVLHQTGCSALLLDPADVPDEPDIHLNPALSWAVRPDRWTAIEATDPDFDADDLVEAICNGEVHPDRRLWAQDMAAGMKVQFRLEDGWPTDLMTRREARDRPWTAMRLAEAMWDGPTRLNFNVGDVPAFALAPYAGGWRDTMQDLKDWHRRQRRNRSGILPSPHLLLAPAVALAVAIRKAGWRPTIVPVPAHDWDFERPGQVSERLAALVGEFAGLPVVRCLGRGRTGDYVRVARTPNRPVVLVDDQITTGKTMRACARLLDTRRLKGCYAITATVSRFPAG